MLKIVLKLIKKKMIKIPKKVELAKFKNYERKIK